jgi:hypothetical protein
MIDLFTVGCDKLWLVNALYFDLSSTQIHDAMICSHNDRYLLLQLKRLREPGEQTTQALSRNSLGEPIRQASIYTSVFGLR